MENINSFQSNEILTGIAILSVLKISQKLEITKCLLIEPLLSYKSIRRHLKTRTIKVRSIEELIVKNNVFFSNFNERFQEKLPLSINSILLFSQLELITIENQFLIFNGDDFDFNEKTLGEVAKSIIATSSNLSEILKEEASSLYLSLRVEL
jgi:hypothetical protein